MAEIYDLIVIGGGSAGLVAAGGAAILGARIALIEKINSAAIVFIRAVCVKKLDSLGEICERFETRRGIRLSSFGFQIPTRIRLAMTHNLSLADLNEAIHIYPTLSQITQAVGTEATLENLKSPFSQKWFERYLKLRRD